MQSDNQNGGVIKATLGACGSRIAIENVGNDLLVVSAGNAREEEFEHNFELSPGQKVCVPKGRATEFDIVASAVYPTLAIGHEMIVFGGVKLPTGRTGIFLAELQVPVYNEQLVLVPNAK